MSNPTPPARPFGSLVVTWRGRVAVADPGGTWQLMRVGESAGACVCPTADLMVRGCTCGHWDRGAKREAKP